jgi:hypothetical protein
MNYSDDQRAIIRRLGEISAQFNRPRPRIRPRRRRRAGT